MKKPFFVLNRERFDRWAEGYDRSILSPFFAYAHHMIIRALNPKQEQRILDVGCGTGKLLGKIYKLTEGKELVGVDYSREMIKVAKEKRSKDIEFKVADACSLQFESDSFDAVVNSFSFHHYSDQNKALGEMNRVLKKNGKLYLADHSFSYPPGLIYLISPLLNLFEGPLKINTRRKMKDMFKEQGFSMNSSHILGFIGALYISEKI